MEIIFFRWEAFCVKVLSLPCFVLSIRKHYKRFIKIYEDLQYESSIFWNIIPVQLRFFRFFRTCMSSFPEAFLLVDMYM